MSENGLIRWYVEQRAQHAESAILANRLVSTIDTAYPNINEAEKSIADAREHLVQQSKENSYALDEVQLEKWDALGLNLFRGDKTLQVAELNEAVRTSVANARRRAKSFDAVRFLHLLEARTATTLHGGSKSSEMSVDTLSS